MFRLCIKITGVRNCITKHLIKLGNPFDCAVYIIMYVLIKIYSILTATATAHLQCKWYHSQFTTVKQRILFLHDNWACFDIPPCRESQFIETQVYSSINNTIYIPVDRPITPRLTAPVRNVKALHAKDGELPSICRVECPESRDPAHKWTMKYKHRTKHNMLDGEGAYLLAHVL